ncbi:LLM class flavin-dependent oxidoreductase [Amycolatopsis sp. H20-H5]|uniref:LLM class flavin-dependent oxidoreductase n=1 Tax=Amycolatopsis sp. H20-H5 TaxID=3046309 RepID=UPI002DBAF058|nr:LLM class flavin-dependent oxidoreductase [Amycolatopsis sp. H20-H5]MEC3980189.1 LLM class flavin-dependent oxidoreductase [Amycolatopsis sp. H20-H5]
MELRVVLPDHLLPPEDYGNVYSGMFEPLITLAYTAATTKTIRLGTPVLILPLREPYALAKQVATLDRLSRGPAGGPCSTARSPRSTPSPTRARRPSPCGSAGRRATKTASRRSAEGSEVDLLGYRCPGP